MLKKIIYTVLKIFYRLEAKGLENFSAAGDRVLLVANHLSFLDPILIVSALPEKPMFAVNTFIANKWFVKPFLSLVKAFPLDPTNPMSTKSIISEIKKNQKCVIFPEGRITVTGSLMKVYEGPGMIADKSGAHILPIRIDRAQYTPFSRLKGKVRIQWFPKITVTFLKPRRFDIDETIKGRKRRHLAGTKLYDLMSTMLFESSNLKQTLFESLMEQTSIHGRKHIIAEDIQRSPVTYGEFLTKCFVLGKQLTLHSKENEYVGLMMPNMVSGVVTFFALQSIKRVPAMINYSSGAQNISAACTAAQIKTIFTSQQFVEKAKLHEVVETLKTQGIEFVFIESLVKKISVLDKCWGWVKSFFPRFFYNLNPSQSEQDAAVVLFTSGSEGTPKGVVLSHQNIQANRYQLASRIDFGPTDKIFNALPIFHSFGLTGGMLLPMLSGIKAFFYPSPLHYRIVPELIYDTNSTIMFGTDTFLSGYARFANAYDFYSVRYVFAGAEKLKEETRKKWSEKYGVRIFEGYGATETAPGLSTNTPMHNKSGTVGRMLPGIDYELEPVAGIEKGGRLIVKGLNVMKGYLLFQNPGVLIPPTHGHYDTGDIVEFDEEGFITIQGRAKRFAKIAGEMVSLTSVESFLHALWPQHMHAVVAVADAKKGEALVLFTNYKEAARPEISAYAKNNGISELSVPKTIHVLSQLPILGTGKVDYVSLQKMLQEKV